MEINKFDLRHTSHAYTLILTVYSSVKANTRLKHTRTHTVGGPACQVDGLSGPHQGAGGTKVWSCGLRNMRMGNQGIHVE